MDLSDYEKSATIRAIMVLRKAEEICRECKYGQITPHVIFAAMTMLEKDFVLKVCDRCGLDFNDVCKACELELGKIQPADDVFDCSLSESAQKLLSIAQAENDSFSRIISLDSLMWAFILSPEMKSVFGDSSAYLGNTNNEVPWPLCDTLNMEDLELEFDPLKGKFIEVYKNRHNEDIITDLSLGGCFA